MSDTTPTPSLSPEAEVVESILKKISACTVEHGEHEAIDHLRILAAEVRCLREELGLLEISLETRTRHLKQCEAALEERDSRLREQLEPVGDTELQKSIYFLDKKLWDIHDASEMEDMEQAAFDVVRAYRSLRSQLRERDAEMTRMRELMPVIDRQGVGFGKYVWMSYDKLCGFEPESEQGRAGFYKTNIIAKKFMEWCESVAALPPNTWVGG